MERLDPPGCEKDFGAVGGAEDGEHGDIPIQSICSIQLEANRRRIPGWTGFVLA
jgi:hypothetical protein